VPVKKKNDFSISRQIYIFRNPTIPERSVDGHAAPRCTAVKTRNRFELVSLLMI